MREMESREVGKKATSVESMLFCCAITLNFNNMNDNNIKIAFFKSLELGYKDSKN